jgi:pantetheine-phosphate adenylyltransferase
MRIAVYPGSFDPITNGHVDLVRRSLEVFDKIVVAVAYNRDKDSALFQPEERVEMIREVLKDLGDRVFVDQFEGLLVDYVKKMNSRVIIRGLRAVSDFEYEFQMAMMNSKLRPEIETLFMMTGESYFYINSRTVKEVASLGGDIQSLVPPTVLERLKGKFGFSR